MQNKEREEIKMSKELNKIYIDGISFTVYEKEYTPQVYYWDIIDAYDKPSEIKKGIWKSWRSWFKSNSEDDVYDYIGICSRNCFRFSINGRITINGERYSFYITQTRNELYKTR